MSVYDELIARDEARAAAIREVIGEQVDRIVAAHDFGTPGAVKRGRTAAWPYVPIIKWTCNGAPRTTQLRGLAYATRQEAVDRATRQIESDRRKLAVDLCRPNNRAQREQHGLPREPV
ncbi:hypothetical protein [Mycobacterium intracellulare]|uniref:hypothetical protein n=1 Tax=Mycobacterium intracellulare TaxID=1767 RepID=UPI002EBD29A0|nr:hypothetical protein [Mycobacterium intracellulare]